MPDQISGTTGMQEPAFILIIGTGIVVMLISLMLDYLWAQILPARFLYYILRCPGVVVHEMAHVLGCLITGAPIRKIVLFSEGGGSVSYSSPKIPVLGDVIISTAPVFVIPLVLAGLSWIFAAYLGCIFPALPFTPGSIGMAGNLAASISALFQMNLIYRFNGWFLLYLYLTLSLVLSVAPSLQDLRNAAAGIALITLAGIFVYLSGIPAAISLMDDLTYAIGAGFTLCLAPGIIALIISLPPVIWYFATQRSA